MKEKTKARQEWIALYRDFRSAMKDTAAQRLATERNRLHADNARVFLVRYFRQQPGGEAVIYAWSKRHWRASSARAIDLWHTRRRKEAERTLCPLQLLGYRRCSCCRCTRKDEGA